MAPQTFEGYSEIGYRITDSNWNIDFLGTVKIYAQSSAQNSIPIIIPLVGNIEMSSLTITPIKEIPPLKRLIYIILTGTLLMGTIVYFSIKKTKWVLSLIALATIGLAFSIYQFFKKTK